MSKVDELAEISCEKLQSPTDRRIDRLVYQLYGLSDEEIRIVEEATA